MTAPLRWAELNAGAGGCARSNSRRHADEFVIESWVWGF
jgi:hypothetical protein